MTKNQFTPHRKCTAFSIEKDQVVVAVYRSNHYLFWELYKQKKHSVGKKQEFLNITLDDMYSNHFALES
jgi:hypothetical protein